MSASTEPSTTGGQRPVIYAAHAWPSNAELVAAAASLGYLGLDRWTLDPTFGRGTFWKRFCPRHLVAHDLAADGVDFRHLPHEDESFDDVVLDGPYKLNGTPTASVDARYGVDVVASREERHALIMAGMGECARVLRPGGHLLVKCQDQVNGGRVRWQTDLFSTYAVGDPKGEPPGLGLEKVDSLLLLGGRPQDDERSRPGCPECGGKVTKVKAGRKCRVHGVVVPVMVLVEQEHARRNFSTLLVFRKPARQRKLRGPDLFDALRRGETP